MNMLQNQQSPDEDASRSIHALRHEIALQDRASALAASRVAQGWLVGGPFILNGSGLVALGNLAANGKFMLGTFTCFWIGFIFALTGAWRIVHHSEIEISLSEMELGVRDAEEYHVRGRQMRTLKRELMVIALISFFAFAGGVSALVDPSLADNLLQTFSTEKSEVAQERVSTGRKVAVAN